MKPPGYKKRIKTKAMPLEEQIEYMKYAIKILSDEDVHKA